MLICKNELPTGSSSVLKEVLSVDLPEKYLYFLTKYNGGITYNTKVKIGRKWDDLDGFYGEGLPQNTYTFEHLQSIGLLEDLVKQGFFPIANNEMGDFYCLSLDSETFGAVYIYYHDLMGKNRKVFSEFKDFIDNIRSEPIGYVPTLAEREATAIANGYEDEIEFLKPMWEKEIKELGNVKQEKVILE
ncbi:SMI1/KNR4 family protein [Streptococcus suis]|nr:SMI1/KNR4 family protein [Streptococcus suis]QGJ85592.1 hypothetical protein [Streptococcus phage phi-SsuFJNP8_rum]